MAPRKWHICFLYRSWFDDLHHRHPRAPRHLVARVGMLGGLLTFGMSIVTLSFLITTPECWVPNLADGNTYAHEGLPYFVGSHGFPMLSGAGRLVIKDIIMSAGGLLVAAEAARRFMATLRK